MKAEKYTLRAYGDNGHELMGEMDTSDDDGQAEFFIREHTKLGNDVHVYALIQMHFAPGQVSSKPKRASGPKCPKTPYNQAWYGAVSIHQLLIDIGGWHVGCENALKIPDAIDYVIDEGWVQHRVQRARGNYPDIQAYEITDFGLMRISNWGGNTVPVEEMRQWHRDTDRRVDK